jgi:trehalose 6-phosphate synthase/phosphatase
MLVEHCGRTVQVKALPIGIPYARFHMLAHTSPRAWAATGPASLRPSLTPSGHPRVILGVDRLDYTKGLVSRLRSFRCLLEKYPQWREKVILLQVLLTLLPHPPPGGRPLPHRGARVP